MKNVFRRIIVSVLSLTLIFSFSGPVSAASHAENGSNVISDDLRWEGFSVRDDLHGGQKTEWETNLEKNIQKAQDEALAKKISGEWTEEQYNARMAEIEKWRCYTEGWLPDGEEYNNSQGAKFWAKNTGWDGNYAPDGTLMGNNPWGLTLTMTKIPVEFTRYYTLEFDIASELEKDVTDEEGNVVKDENGRTVTERMEKVAMVKAFDYRSKGEPGAAFETIEQTNTETLPNLNGTITIPKTEKNTELNYSHVKATFKIPDTKNEWGGGQDKGAYTFMGLKFAFGAFMVDAEDQVALRGYIHVKNLKILAGTQYAVTYYDGKTPKTTKYINEYDPARKISLTKKGQTLQGFTYNGKLYTGSVVIPSVTADSSVYAKWISTPKPNKAAFKLKSKKKKKVTVTFGANKNARGYEVKYSLNKKFKTKKKYKTATKTTWNTSTYTISAPKSKKVLYVKARAFNTDSTGAKVFGNWSGRKKVYVK